ncbi:hypothetical protein AU198_22005 [Mycobacterium sp. GA-1199]|uniref:hypothetical protein n=1 Tax=Mycobacterium sp. GA-1199 TaxID=1772287 RepID=UPI000747B238|nr:hypothetical protein [Mycobacterium sp. GA-1199]KUI48617.1 hypothetical protein AU198_22005 [Mycobacterium sp. GA-1199]
MRNWLTARFGRMRMSTVVLIAAFVALFWVNQTFEAKPPEPPPAPAVVPPGFVPDPNYTWVPRTNVRRTTEPTTTTTTTTTSPPTTTTTSPTETPTSPTTTVTDPDGPGPRQPVTQTIGPDGAPPTTDTPLVPPVPQLLPPPATTPPS